MTLDINITLRADNSLLDLLRSAAFCLPGRAQTPAAAPQTPIPAPTPNPAPDLVGNPTPRVCAGCPDRRPGCAAGWPDLCVPF